MAMDEAFNIQLKFDLGYTGQSLRCHPDPQSCNSAIPSTSHGPTAEADRDFFQYLPGVVVSFASPPQATQPRTAPGKPGAAEALNEGVSGYA